MKKFLIRLAAVAVLLFAATAGAVAEEVLRIGVGDIVFINGSKISCSVANPYKQMVCFKHNRRGDAVPNTFGATSRTTPASSASTRKASRSSSSRRRIRRRIRRPEVSPRRLSWETCAPSCSRPQLLTPRCWSRRRPGRALPPSRCRGRRSRRAASAARSSSWAGSSSRERTSPGRTHTRPRRTAGGACPTFRCASTMRWPRRIVAGHTSSGAMRRTTKAETRRVRPSRRRLEEVAADAGGRAAAGAAVAGGRLDGRRHRSRRRRVPRSPFDLRTSKWGFVPGPGPRERLAVTSRADKVYALAGNTTTAGNFARFQMYTPATRRWRNLPPGPGHARRHRGCRSRQPDRLGRRRGARRTIGRLRLQREDAALVATRRSPDAAPRPGRRRLPWARVRPRRRPRAGPARQQRERIPRRQVGLTFAVGLGQLVRGLLGEAFCSIRSSSCSWNFVSGVSRLSRSRCSWSVMTRVLSVQRSRETGHN